MKLYVARHGRTNYNDLRLCNGDPAVDVYLTDLGKQQAQALAEKLSEAAIDHIFVSQHKRTHQTAEFVNKFHDAPVTIEARLNDNRSGFEGKPASEYYAALAKAEDKWTARLNDGESIEDVKTRVRSFIDELRALDHQTVLIVTSEIIAQTMYGILKQVPNEEAYAVRVEQGSVIEFTL